MTKERTFAILFGLAALSALALAACGGDDDSAQTSATTTGQATAAATSSGAAGTTEASTAVTSTSTSGASATDASNGGSDNDPCTLLTQSEVEDAFDGVSMNPGVLTAVGNTTVATGITANVASCAFSSVNTVDSLSIDVWAAPGQDDTIKSMTALICQGKESVSDIGDGACWYSSDHDELQFSKGANYVDMRATTATLDPVALLTSLASDKVVDRLP